MKADKIYQIDFEHAMRVQSFMSNAFEDYLAARHLLISGFLIQGTILANTALEKYFKSLVALLNERIPMHHDITVNKIQNTLKNKFKPIYNSLNQEFLEFLSKAYKYRYIDSLEVNYNIVIYGRKTLAELDFVVNIFEESLKIVTPTNASGDSNYQQMKVKKNSKLLNENYLLNNISKADYLKESGKAWTFRKLSSGKYVSALIVVSNLKDDGKFLFEGINQNEKSVDA